MDSIFVKKSTNEHQLYSLKKLRKSLLLTGASEQDIEKIIDYIDENAYDGISTRLIYEMAFNQLKKISPSFSTYYGTKRALLELGPDGFLFERFIEKLYQYLGYETKTGVWLDGRCISHEIDVVAKNDKKVILVECKFHNNRDRSNDVKTALYIKARAEDIEQSKSAIKFDEFWFISNTAFSSDAIRYANCANLFIWGANFPPQKTLQDTIQQHKLYPITCLSNLRKYEKKHLLEKDILLLTELKENLDIFDEFEIEEKRKDRIFEELNKILGIRKS